MDGLSKSLQSVNVGCTMHGTIINHLCYADDSCLICPSVKGMQRLLDVCSDYANDHDIVFNTGKSVGMLIKSKTTLDVTK
jgi:hypothetical protein